MNTKSTDTKERSASDDRSTSGSQRHIGYGIVLGIVMGAFIGPLFDQTVIGMILGFALGMGLGGILDARNNRRR